MRTKRFIRLKEIAPLVETYHTPTPAQVECSDESLIVQPYLCRTDKDGYMMNGNGIKSGLRSIVFMGDSFVESMYSEETDRFVSQTERLLEVGGERFQCLNAGYSGSSTLQIVNSLINKVYPTVGPNSYVVLQVPHSDRATSTRKAPTGIKHLAALLSYLPRGQFRTACRLVAKLRVQHSISRSARPGT